MSDAPLIPTAWDLSAAIRQRLGSTAGRQRMMHADGQILLVLHEVPQTNIVSRRGLLFWRDAQGQWLGSDGSQGVTAIEHHLQRYADRLEEFDQLERVAQRADQYSHLLEGLAPVARAVRHMSNVLAEARQAVPDDRPLIDQRDRAYELARWAELLYDDAKNSMDVAVVKRAEEQAAASHRMLVTAHRLNILAALFFPFGTLGAIFGTTLTDNWQWSHSILPFVGFLMVGLVAGLLLAASIARCPPT